MRARFIIHWFSFSDLFLYLYFFLVKSRISYHRFPNLKLFSLGFFCFGFVLLYYFIFMFPFILFTSNFIYDHVLSVILFVIWFNCMLLYLFIFNDRFSLILVEFYWTIFFCRVKFSSHFSIFFGLTVIIHLINSLLHGLNFRIQIMFRILLDLRVVYINWKFFFCLYSIFIWLCFIFVFLLVYINNFFAIMLARSSNLIRVALMIVICKSLNFSICLLFQTFAVIFPLNIPTFLLSFMGVGFLFLLIMSVICKSLNFSICLLLQTIAVIFTLYFLTFLFSFKVLGFLFLLIILVILTFIMKSFWIFWTCFICVHWLFPFFTLYSTFNSDFLIVLRRLCYIFFLSCTRFSIVIYCQSGLIIILANTGELLIRNDIGAIDADIYVTS